MRKTVGKTDVILLIILSAVCALLFYLSFHSGKGKTTAVIYEDGKITHTVDLKNADNETMEINGSRILIENGSISYLESDCADKTCIKFGKLSKAGDFAACIPNKTVIVITGEKEDSVDVITY